MGYLSQLARETASRVLPPRQGPWAPRIPQLAEERIVEWPAIPSREESGAAAKPHESAGNIGVRPPLPQEVQALPVGRIATIERRARPASTPADNKESGDENEIARHERLAATAPAIETSSAETRQPARRTELLAPSPREQDSNVVDFSASLRPRAAEAEAYPALQSVLDEIARRQRALEREYRQEEPLAPRAMTVHSSGERATITEPYLREQPIEEQIHLSIGSIVVRVDPESGPPRPSTMPERRPRPARDTSNRWARSFLDR